MDNNNWRPLLSGGEPTTDSGDWRARLPPESRQKILNKVMETLKKHVPCSGPDGINEFRRIAARFEEKVFYSSTSQTEYLRKISMRMLSMESKYQNSAATASTSVPGAVNSPSLDSGSSSLQPQGQPQTNMASASLQSSMTNNSNNNNDILQDSSNMLSSSQRQKLGRQPNLLHSSPQLSIPTSVMQSSSVNSQSVLRQHQPALMRQSQQAAGNHQPQTSSRQQQQAHLLRQQAGNNAAAQQSQMMSQQNIGGDIQQQQSHQHQQRLLSQQNNLMNTQQQQQQPSSTHQQQQTQLLSSQVHNPSLQTNHQSMHMLPQSKPGLQQRTHQAGQPSQQQQPNLLQQDAQQRLQGSGQVAGSLRQPQAVMDQQRQLYPSQRTLPEMPSSSLDSSAQTGNANGGDWKEEAYQKVKSMREMYLPELSEIHKRIALKIQQQESLPQQQPRLEQFEKLKQYKSMLERMIGFLSVNKSSILPSMKNKLGIYEKQIVNFLISNRPKKRGVLQQGESQRQSMNMQSGLSNGVSAPQHNMPNNSTLPSGQQQGLNSNVLQHQPQDQQMTQQLKQQLQQRQMQQQQQQQLLQKQQKQRQLQGRQQMADEGMYQQHPLQGQRPLQHLKPAAQLPVSSPPQIDQKNMSAANKTGGRTVPSPSSTAPLIPSTMTADSDKPVINTSSSLPQQAAVASMPALPQSLAIGSPGISASPLLQETTSPPDGVNVNPLPDASGESSGTEQPMDRLVRAMKSVSSKALSAAVSDIVSVVSMVDRLAGSAPGKGSRASVGEDLAAMTKCRLQARNSMTQDVVMETRNMKRHTVAVPLSAPSSGGDIRDDLKRFAGLDASDMESKAGFAVKRARTETNDALVEEIRDINRRLIDTVVEISDEEGDVSGGTIVRLSFVAVSLSPSFKAYLSSTQMTLIPPLRLWVPANYPNCSPAVLDKVAVESSKEKEELWGKAWGGLSRSMKSVEEPMSLREVAKTWDACARSVLCQYALQFGGGTFTSKYGSWDNKFIAAA